MSLHFHIRGSTVQHISHNLQISIHHWSQFHEYVRKSRGKNCKTGQRLQSSSSGARSAIGAIRLGTDLRGANKGAHVCCIWRVAIIQSNALATKTSSNLSFVSFVEPDVKIRSKTTGRAKDGGGGGWGKKRSKEECFLTKAVAGRFVFPRPSFRVIFHGSRDREAARCLLETHL